MSGDSVTGLLVMLGKAQVDAVFCRQADYPVDDSEFLPLVEAVLTGFEMVGIDEEVAEDDEIMDHEEIDESGD